MVVVSSQKVELSDGDIILTDPMGNRSRYALKPSLANIPTGLTYSQVAAITTLANLVVVLIRTLIERQVLDESFADSLGMDWDLDHIIQVVEQMGGKFHDPDFDNV